MEHKFLVSAYRQEHTVEGKLLTWASSMTLS